MKLYKIISAGKVLAFSISLEKLELVCDTLNEESIHIYAIQSVEVPPETPLSEVLE